MGQPMDLNFHLFETASLLITVLVVALLLQVLEWNKHSWGTVLLHSCKICLLKFFLFTLQDGTSNCFKGLMLILCYLIVAASFYVYADPNIDGRFLFYQNCCFCNDYIFFPLKSVIKSHISTIWICIMSIGNSVLQVFSLFETSTFNDGMGLYF